MLEANCLPLYRQLKDILLEKIEKMEWPDGELPSEAKLCEEYQVSRITVRRAISELESEGRVYRKQGKGTYIKIDKVEQKLPDFYSFTDQMRRRGWTPSTKVIEFGLVVPEHHVAQSLNMAPGEKAFRFTRYRYANNVLMAVQTTWLPEQHFPGLTKEMLEEKPMYEIMRDQYGIVPVSAKQWVGASIVYQNENTYFFASTEIAVLDIERVASDGDKPVEYTHTLSRGDKFRFQIDLS